MKKAEWIWLDKKAESDEYAAFDDGFYWDGKTRLKLKISVAGDYNAYINGSLSRSVSMRILPIIKYTTKRRSLHFWKKEKTNFSSSAGTWAEAFPPAKISARG